MKKKKVLMLGTIYWTTWTTVINRHAGRRGGGGGEGSGDTQASFKSPPGDSNVRTEVGTTDRSTTSIATQTAGLGSEQNSHGRDVTHRGSWGIVGLTEDQILPPSPPQLDFIPFSSSLSQEALLQPLCPTCISPFSELRPCWHREGCWEAFGILPSYYFWLLHRGSSLRDRIPTAS